MNRTWWYWLKKAKWSYKIKVLGCLFGKHDRSQIDHFAVGNRVVTMCTTCMRELRSYTDPTLCVRCCGDGGFYHFIHSEDYGEAGEKNYIVCEECKGTGRLGGVSG